MESNKSKGVEFRNELQNRVESLLYDTLNQDFRNRKDVCKALQDIVDEALAHPQQSEATLTDHATSIGTPIQTTAAASEGVGTTDSICGDLEDRQAAEGLTQSWHEKLKKYLISEPLSLREDQANLISLYVIRCAESQPSEPAALKEPQGSAPAVVIADGEIESIAIELISKHGRWADDEMEYQASEYEFTAALKEFASLLTNHKS